MDKKFNTAVLGGTFDHLHKGHKEFISFALALSKKAVIGLTSDGYIQNSKFKMQNSKLIENYEERKRALKAFLREENVDDRAKIVKIDDIYGITLDKNIDIDAIVVVEKTLAGAEKINAKREELGLKPLKIVIAPSVTSEDGQVISSSRIRDGEIDREGKLFIKPDWLTSPLILPENLREELRKSLGPIIEDDNFNIDKNLVITVGDVTSQKFNNLSLNQKISIIDFNVARKKKFDTVLQLGFTGDEKVVKVENPAGQITSQLFSAIIKAFSRETRVIIEVSGEEDLAVLPAILAAPLGSLVFYGQPEEGLVKVLVSENMKEKVYRLLTEFEISS
ncbi:MAG: pantetheine-phosphate adenylyltransferase [Candidatus Levybacteria bacterium]|nr:pantetheine-phosphate adenylyltransferase [Candidatus Levybacteria bacterium]